MSRIPLDTDHPRIMISEILEDVLFVLLGVSGV